jgi:hypothetical protein
MKEVADHLAIDHALKEDEIAQNLSDASVECRGETGLRPHEEDLDWAAAVSVTCLPGAVDGRGHLLTPSEILSKAISDTL